jgi:hypothetical protein
MNRTPLDARLWARVNLGGPNECWEWTGPKTAGGYGVISSGGRGGRLLRTHRLAYELKVGPIAEGLHLDHLCRNRACCNPVHLEPVTQAENNRRAFANHTHCPRGHVLPPKTPPGVRRPQCRTCKNDHDRRVYAERKSA